jgi:hypothetical protein
MSKTFGSSVQKSAQEIMSPAAPAKSDLRSKILESVRQSVPGIESRWDHEKTVASKATEAVETGIKTACEISVALSSSKAEAEGHIDQATRQLASRDKSAMGLHLGTRLEAIDSAIQKAERDRWGNYSTEQKQFVVGKFKELCSGLDEVSRDPALISHCSEVRQKLFPKVTAAEHQLDFSTGFRPALVYTGPKGVADLMQSEAGKGIQNNVTSAGQGHDNAGTGSPRPGTLSSQGIKLVSRLVQGLRREDSPNVCQR